MKHITEDMILELNNDLSNNECPFRYKLDNFDSTIMTIKISLPSMNGVDSFIINTSQEHKEWLRKWFLDKGIELNCNNTGSMWWGFL